jgi:hypothetical protein
MSHDTDYFRRRVAEARAAAVCKEPDDAVDVAGGLALAYAALARRRAAAAAVSVGQESVVDSPLLAGD